MCAFLLAHTAQTIGEAWGTIFAELAALGIMADTARPILERYLPDKVERHLCEICVPVVDCKKEKQVVD